MKHLRRFNESLDYDSLRVEDDFQDYCEENLAYLIDDGMKVTIDWFVYDKKNHWKGHEVYLNDINKPWIEIKDQIIPFFIRLNKQYNLGLIYNDEDWTVGFGLEDDTYYYDVNEIIDEGVGYDNEYDGTNNYDDTLNREGVIVNHIVFYVKSKKNI